MAKGINIGGIYGEFSLDNKGAKQVLQQTKAEMAKAAVEMQKSARVKVDLEQWKQLSSQMQALKARAQETRMALLKAAPDSEDAKKLQGTLAGLNKQIKLIKDSTGPARKELERLAKTADDSLKRAGERMSGFGRSMSMFVTAPIIAAGAAMLKFAGEMEQSELAFTTLLGSAEKAKTFIKELREFAAATPFELPGLMDSSRKLLAFGFEAKQIIPMMRSIGDAVSALGGGEAEISRVTTALGQMKAKGKVSAEEMMQLAELGIPAWQMLADKIGVTIPEAMKMAEKGQISAAQGIDAVLSGMSTKFAGMMEKQSKTLLGQWSTFKDNARAAMTDLGTAIIPAAQAALQALQPLLGMVGKMAQAFAALPGPAQTAVLAFAGMAAAAGPLLMVIGQMAQGWKSFVDVLGTVQDRLKKSGGAMKSAKSALGGLGGALTLAAAGVALFVYQVQRVGAEVDQMAEKVWRDKDAVDALNASLSKYKEQLRGADLHRSESQLRQLYDQRNEAKERLNKVEAKSNWWNYGSAMNRAAAHEERAEIQRTSKRIEVVRERIKEIKGNGSVYGGSMRTLENATSTPVAPAAGAQAQQLNYMQQMLQRMDTQIQELKKINAPAVSS
ncbi:MAG: tape measure protein [Armatimonadetes bacterium]|nr:tape measure protein [Armatimonadota bacterium]